MARCCPFSPCLSPLSSAASSWRCAATTPIEAFGAILAGSFGSQRAIVQTLTQATPLIFTGLAFAFAKKASLINLGAEGQLYMGALASAAWACWIWACPWRSTCPWRWRPAWPPAASTPAWWACSRSSSAPTRSSPPSCSTPSPPIWWTTCSTGPCWRRTARWPRRSGCWRRRSSPASSSSTSSPSPSFWQWRPVSWSSCHGPHRPGL